MIHILKIKNKQTNKQTNKQQQNDIPGSNNCVSTTPDILREVN